MTEDILRAPADRARRRGLAVLMELAAPTHGWFRSRDAVARGVSPSTLTRLRSTGVIETPWKNLNRLTSFPDTWEGRALGALWAAGPHAALGRYAALRVLLDRSSSPAIDVVSARHRGLRGAVVPIRHHARLTDDDVVERRGLRVTAPSFTIADLAAVMPKPELLRTADRFISVRAFSIDDLRMMTARFREIEGVGDLREVLDQLSPSSRWTRSDGERMWLRIVRDIDTEEPRANVRVVDADGNVRYLDFAWPDRKVAVEIDLHPSHGTTLGRRSDGTRQNALVLQGWTVLRFDLADLMTRPDHVRRTVARALGLPTA